MPQTQNQIQVEKDRRDEIIGEGEWSSHEGDEKVTFLKAKINQVGVWQESMADLKEMMSQMMKKKGVVEREK